MLLVSPVALYISVPECLEVVSHPRITPEGKAGPIRKRSNHGRLWAFRGASNPAMAGPSGVRRGYETTSRQGTGLLQDDACLRLSVRHIPKLTLPPINCPFIPAHRAGPVNLIIFRHQLDFQCASAGLSIRSSPAHRVEINRNSSRACRGISDNISQRLESDVGSGDAIAGKKFVEPGLHVNGAHRSVPPFLMSRVRSHLGLP